MIASRQYSTSSLDQWGLGFYNNRYAWIINSATAGTRVLYGSTAPIGQWIHVAGVYDGSTTRLYVNGAQTASSALTGAIRRDTARPVYIGGNQNTTSTGAPQQFFRGRIDDLRIYGRALSAAEIQALATP